MNPIDRHGFADMFFQARWHSTAVRHTEAYNAGSVNLWRDILPEPILHKLTHCSSGDLISMGFAPGTLVSEFDENLQLTLKRRQFNSMYFPSRRIEPRCGRFFPRGMLKDVTGIFRANMEPFRLVEIENGHIHTDFNHPLARQEVALSVTVSNIQNSREERGGASQHWMEMLLDGPGMQARWNDVPTDFFSDAPFRREDERPDTEFYRKPRLLHHLDAMAREIIASIYGRLVMPGAKVLDLMTSWVSHLPRNLSLDRVSGMGLNETELEQNTTLTDHVVKDLNQDPALPFDTATFDAIICTASVEYLIEPLAVFNEAARVLKPGGYFIHTFSNRWFPSKAIRIWADLNEFERMGLILEYFHGSEAFESLETYSVRGLPRPREDKYYGRIRYSDPVYAVWGRKKT